MPLPRNDYLYCSHLSENSQTVSDIAGFRVRNPETGKGLEEYLKQQAMPDEKHHLMRTYLVRHCETHELVGYFSLKAGLISCDETKQQGAILFNTIPGVELANFAVNECFVAKTGIRGIGKTIFFRTDSSVGKGRG